MSNYKQSLNKLNIYHELLANRYLLTTLLTNVYTLIDLIYQKDMMIRRLMTPEERAKHCEIKHQLDELKFEYFTISNKEFSSLVNKYGDGVTTDAAVLLDQHIKSTGKVYKKPYRVLKVFCERLAKRQSVQEELTEVINTLRNMDYTLIDNKELAERYIKAQPSHLRNIDKGCIYLKEKFNI